MRTLAPDVSVIDHRFSVGGLPLGLRTTVVRLPDGGVWLGAPGPLAPADVEAIRALGPVRAVVAPNLFHHLYVRAALDAFPGARLHAPARLAKKRPDLAIDEPLGDEAPAAWGGAIEAVHVGGMPKLDEHVFFHRPSRTLVVTDLAFNVHRAGNPWAWLALTLNDALGRFGPSRISRSMMKDRAVVAAATRRMIAWEPLRVVTAHGDVLEEDAAATLRAAFAFLER